MPTLQGKYKVPHFDAKGEANAFFAELGVPDDLPPHVVLLGQPHPLRHGPEEGPGRQAGLRRCRWATRSCPASPPRTSAAAPTASSSGPELIGKTVGIAGEHLTGAQMAAELGKALGRRCVYNAVPPEVYRGFGFPGADDLGNMFQFKRDFEKDFCGARDLGFSRRLNPQLQTFAAVARRQQGADPARLSQPVRGARRPDRDAARRTSRRLNATPEPEKRNHRVPPCVYYREGGGPWR